ncbi:MAG: glycoside hydrolase family 5 protein [Acidobacteriota bacterium]
MTFFNRFAASALLLLAVGILSCSPEHVSSSTDNGLASDTTGMKTASAGILDMGTGFNLGNTFDLAANSTAIENIRPIIDLYYQAGMRHIRIPTTWMEGYGGNTLANANGTVNFQHPRFLQLEAVIQYALQRKMYVVLNAHHEHWLKDNYDGSAHYDSVFTTLWRGIADHFKTYSDHLIFEVLNEPDGTMGDWNGGPTPNDPKALALTRKINEVGYRAIRSAGGNNMKRVIMVSTNGMGNQSQIEEVYPSTSSLPGGGTDQYLAIQVHTYDPWSFCGETGQNSAYPGTTAIINAVDLVSIHAQKLGVPINYGEFGVGRKTNSLRNAEAVREYYRAVRLSALSRNMSVTPWDDRGWFALITKNTAGSYEFLYNIVPSMMAP